VGIGELQACLCQLVDVWCPDAGCWVVAGGIAVAEIIRQQQHNIGPGRYGRSAGSWGLLSIQGQRCHCNEGAEQAAQQEVAANLPDHLAADFRRMRGIHNDWVAGAEHGKSLSPDIGFGKAEPAGNHMSLLKDKFLVVLVHVVFGHVFRQSANDPEAIIAKADTAGTMEDFRNFVACDFLKGLAVVNEDP
jgi:hypothetical protein